FDFAQQLAIGQLPFSSEENYLAGSAGFSGGVVAGVAGVVGLLSPPQPTVVQIMAAPKTNTHAQPTHFFNMNLAS
ncbi:MAG TPA: hypothetical protein VGJ15_06015, partial [Pirellulales bacterium]